MKLMSSVRDMFTEKSLEGGLGTGKKRKVFFFSTIYIYGSMMHCG